MFKFCCKVNCCFDKKCFFCMVFKMYWCNLLGCLMCGGIWFQVMCYYLLSVWWGLLNENGFCLLVFFFDVVWW